MKIPKSFIVFIIGLIIVISSIVPVITAIVPRVVEFILIFGGFGILIWSGHIIDREELTEEKSKWEIIEIIILFIPIIIIAIIMIKTTLLDPWWPPW